MIAVAALRTPGDGQFRRSDMCVNNCAAPVLRTREVTEEVHLAAAWAYAGRDRFACALGYRREQVPHKMHSTPLPRRAAEHGST